VILKISEKHKKRYHQFGGIFLDIQWFN